MNNTNSDNYQNNTKDSMIDNKIDSNNDKINMWTKARVQFIENKMMTTNEHHRYQY